MPFWPVLGNIRSDFWVIFGPVPRGKIKSPDFAIFVPIQVARAIILAY